MEDDEEHDNTTGSGPDGMKLTSTTSSPKPSKRGLRKRVVSIPIKEVEGVSSSCRLKGSEISSPPLDSWAWRKYGQKPIKGSPYPRGYYKCSSWKGCPARKQVERSRVDPTTLVVTYSSDHNHPSAPPPPTRPHHHNPKLAAVDPDTPPANPEPEPNPDRERFANFEDEFSWFGEMEATSSSAILDTPLLVAVDVEMFSSLDVFLPMREEDDESLFADLGELPECTSVFRHHRGMGTEVQIC